MNKLIPGEGPRRGLPLERRNRRFRLNLVRIKVRLFPEDPLLKGRRTRVGKGGSPLESQPPPGDLPQYIPSLFANRLSSFYCSHLRCPNPPNKCLAILKQSPPHKYCRIPSRRIIFESELCTVR